MSHAGVQLGFSMVPAVPAPMPATADQNFPKLLQFQFNGVNLGGPDADTVNFIGSGFTLVRIGDTVRIELS
jgi:hypothetical protein